QQLAQSIVEPRLPLEQENVVDFESGASGRDGYFDIAGCQHGVDLHTVDRIGRLVLVSKAQLVLADLAGEGNPAVAAGWGSVDQRGCILAAGAEPGHLLRMG